MIRARYRLCSLQEWREIDDWVAARNRFAVAKGDWGRVWRRWIREVELIEDFVCALRGEPLKFLQSRTSGKTQGLLGSRRFTFHFDAILTRASQEQSNQGREDVLPKRTPRMPYDDTGRDLFPYQGRSIAKFGGWRRSRHGGTRHENPTLHAWTQFPF